MEKRRAIYPGSFDPVTYGHLDIIKRALCLFDEVIVAVAANAEKTPLFSVDVRVRFLQRAVKDLRGVRVEPIQGLTVKYAVKMKARTLIRGLRATSDFDYEFQMALTNRQLSRQVDTVFLMPSESYFYISSRLIKEIASSGGRVDGYVPLFVAREIEKILQL
ncbi:MAG: pantetheine-phosphate adenylyltransferase [Omnitrophica bacterium GWA2_52_8]|nr:MAG: pantetheine-phosphate adenylyltransferase [Omnitrophica bacterium GWA2_52_8]